MYRLALDFARWTAERQPASGHLRDQLLRAADSVVLNVAEGAQQQTKPMARKHYRIALGSAAECAAILDLLEIRASAPSPQSRQILDRIGMMLRRLAR